ncbi:hypothetical protein [Actinomadura macrotermitis]|nr:hypothetical protein [Actinomadura macrotermitis]
MTTFQRNALGAAIAVALAFLVGTCGFQPRFGYRSLPEKPGRHMKTYRLPEDKVLPSTLEGSPVVRDEKLAIRPAKSGVLTEAELSGDRAKQVQSRSGKLTYRQVERVRAPCEDMLWKLDKVLPGTGCTQVARTVYHSTDGSYHALLAVIDVRDQKSAERLRQALTRKTGFVRIPMTVNFPKGARWERAHVTGLGHYVTVTWLQPTFPNRTSPDTAAEFARSAPRDPWAPILRAHR